MHRHIWGYVYLKEHLFSFHLSPSLPVANGRNTFKSAKIHAMSGLLCNKSAVFPLGSHIQENRINFLRSILWLGSKVYHLIHIFSKNQLEIHVKRPLNSALKIMRGLLNVGLLLSSFQIAHGRTSPDIAMLFCGSCNQHKFYNDQKQRFTRIWASI